MAAATERQNLFSTAVHGEIAMIAEKLREIQVTVCPECDGIGHTRKKCPTYKRLLGLTKGLAASRVVMNAARVRVTGQKSKTLGGKRMQWH